MVLHLITDYRNFVLCDLNCHQNLNPLEISHKPSQNWFMALRTLKNTKRYWG